MARTEAEAAAKKRAERNKRYAAKFYLTDGCEFYDILAAIQDYKCGVCGRPFSDFTVSMNFDHKHFKVEYRRSACGNWYAWTRVLGHYVDTIRKTQAAAIQEVKRVATPLSIRGLLCPGRYTGCNRLAGRVDKIDWLEKLLAYLRNPPAQKSLADVKKI